MKFAIPILNGQITAHFGHCEKFAIVETNNSNEVTNEGLIDPPVHTPGAYPRYLAEQGVDVIIAGGMGQKAQDLFAQNNIKVYLGLSAGTAKELVESYLNNELDTGDNLCTH